MNWMILSLKQTDQCGRGCFHTKRSYHEIGIILLFSLLLLHVTGCAVRVSAGREHQENTNQREDLWIREELYFGSDMPDGGIVFEAQWREFADSVITPRFSEGFTVLEGRGQYRYQDGRIVKERTRIVVLLRRSQDSGADKRSARSRVSTSPGSGRNRS